jgi:hypothetical protein
MPIPPLAAALGLSAVALVVCFAFLSPKQLAALNRWFRDLRYAPLDHAKTPLVKDEGPNKDRKWGSTFSLKMQTNPDSLDSRKL